MAKKIKKVAKVAKKKVAKKAKKKVAKKKAAKKKAKKKVAKKKVLVEGAIPMKKAPKRAKKGKK
jgi:hypothetical protein